MTTKVKPWEPAVTSDLVLSNLRIIDPVSGSVSEPSSVWLSGGNIKAISNQKHTAFKDGPDAVDLKGKYLCPGLIDCHVHVTACPGETRMRDLWDADPDTLAWRTAWTVKQMLLRGFTTARDNAGATFALREAINEGLIPGPRLFIAGKALSQTGGHGDLRQPHEGDSFKCCSGHGPSFARICDGVPQCLAAARDELRRGADHLKIMVGGGVASPVDPLDMLQFSGEEIRAITQSAANLGKYVTAHAYTDKAITLAIENGVKGIEHANFISKHVARRCAEMGVIVTPTLSTYKAMMSAGDFLPESGRRKCQEVLASGVSSLKTLHEAGVLMCFGTDLLANMHEHQNGEFRLREEALPRVEILRSATTNAAKRLNMEGKLGVVKEGAFADLLILDSNPLDDLAALADIQDHCFGIVKEGRVVSSRLEDDGLNIDSLYRTA